MFCALYCTCTTMGRMYIETLTDLDEKKIPASFENMKLFSAKINNRHNDGGKQVYLIAAKLLFLFLQQYHAIVKKKCDLITVQFSATP